MSTGTRPTRRRLEPAERRAEILAVARRLFGAGSYASVSTSDIAAAAGVARPLINHYFGGKRELYLEVVRQMMIVPAPVVEALPEGPVRRRLEVGIERWIDVVDRNRDAWLTAIGPEAAGRDPEIERIMLEADDVAADRVLAAALMTDVSEGREQLRAMIRSYGGMLRAASREWLIRGTLKRDELRTFLVESIMNLLEVTYPAVLAERTAARRPPASSPSSA
ncbi:TetR/AcrR family transcriptional regulator [Amycolatopsis sp. FDAARGOS 1241]|uniref:TetR/AcrR family transcriptional regulator n=1 Tax=Amycolatopsis sp. FDAARGOS 1241 TaxID=2778070 RepID=UPI00195216D4|nr:TetR/AcrR family transcriptional regulator [Amycolatopsis sp. FDAARGOS 1241]QRP44641.1 TetR/AcrR family transcriptional regulator [Amycolatopsis sp. FDAARGOS 1241]